MLFLSQELEILQIEEGKVVTDGRNEVKGECRPDIVFELDKATNAVS